MTLRKLPALQRERKDQTPAPQGSTVGKRRGGGDRRKGRLFREVGLWGAEALRRKHFKVI